MKVLFIYTLNVHNFKEDFIDYCTDKFKVDLTVFLEAENQIENVQYPYFEIETIE